MREGNQAGPESRKAASLHRGEERYAEKDDSARERERERERDVSATLTRPITDVPTAHGLSTTLFPNELTRTTTPSQLRPGPSPKVPV